MVRTDNDYWLLRGRCAGPIQSALKPNHLFHRQRLQMSRFYHRFIADSPRRVRNDASD
jgi:hypothetical protein